MTVDITDIHNLDKYNDSYDSIITVINNLLDSQLRMKLILIDEIEPFDLPERVSFENKLIKVRSKIASSKMVDDFLKNENELKKAENRKKQIEEAIRSTKKKMEILKESGLLS